ncbi:MAG: glycosyltransferase, partial [Candidatus Rokuibacteriota bacterium]
MKALIGVGVASHPLSAAGNTWASLQWVLGFRELGWEVWMIESLASDRCVDAGWKPSAFPESANGRHWRQVVDRFGLGGSATLLLDGDAASVREAKRFAAGADLFLNISGHFKAPDFRMPRARRVYLDLDPAFTQIWADVYGADMNFTGHDAFFSVGSRLGRDGCLAPTCGIDWLPTLPPVVLTHWRF